MPGYDEIIAQMKAEQSVTGTGPSPYDNVAQDMARASQQSASRAAMVVGVQSTQNPDQAALHSALAKRYNTSPQVVSQFPQEFKDRMALEMARSNLKDAPKLQDTINANPNTAAIIHDDLPNAAAVESVAGRKSIGESLADTPLEMVKGLGGSFNKAGSSLNTLLGAFPVIYDKMAGGTGAQDWWFKNMVDPLVSKEQYFRPDSNAGFAEKAGNMSGNLIGMLSQIMLTGGAGEAAPAAQGVQTAGQAVKGMVEHGTKSMAFPSLVESVDVGRKVYEQTGDPVAASKAAQMAYLTTTLGGVMPLSLPGGLGTRLATGFGTGVVTGEANRQLMNSVMPTQMQAPFDPEEMILSGLAGSVLSIGGPRGERPGYVDAVRETYRQAAQADQASRDFQSMSALSELSTASKWRERDPEGFRQFVEQATEDGELANVFIEAKQFAQSMDKLGMKGEELQRQLPELAEQMREALATDGYVRINTADYAAKIAGGKLDAELLPHLKTDPEGKTFAEAQSFFQEHADAMKQVAAKLAEQKVQQDAFRDSQKKVQEQIQTQLDQVGRMSSDVNRVNATIQTAFLSRLAAREGITPEAALSKYGASVRGEGKGALSQITPEQAMRTSVAVKMPEHAEFADAVKNTEGAEITPEGLRIDLQRHQKPEQSGDYSVRTGVFYLPRGDANAKHYRGGKAGYGGNELHTGETLLRAPLFVKGATGGKAPEAAYIDLKGKEAFAEMSRAVTQVLTGTSYMRPDPARKLQLIEEFLDNYAPEMSSRAAELERVSREGNTLRYALQEAAVAHAVREAGYDSVVGYSKGKVGAKISEVFDVREQTYPAHGVESEVHNAFNQDARGSYEPTTRTIALLKDADLSTYLHETGHWALDVYGRIAGQADAPPEIRSDMEHVLKWFGVESLEKWNSMTLDEQRPHHEQFARSFEAYLFEGKAPSAELRPFFARIRAWMVSIYKSLRNLDVQLTDDVRGVFDRMLASEEAIVEAQASRMFAPLFKEKPAGMTDEEWTKYLELGDEATLEAIEDMQSRSLRDLKWLSNAKSKALREVQKKADTQRKEVQTQVEAEVDAMPIYAAERWIKKGETVQDGEVIQVAKEGLPGTKLNTERVKEMFPEGALDRPEMDKLKGMTGPKGMDPDMMADMFGFESGEQLVRNLIDREPRESVVQGLTDRRMLEQHGELSTPQAIDAAASEAIHNEVRGRFVATGLKVLTKSPIPARELLRGAREAAEGAIAAKRVRDVNPRQYEAAETKANKEALKYAAKEPARAVQAQRASLLNNQLAKASRQALTDVDKAVAYFKRLDKKAAQDNMRGEYLEQLNELLARFDLRTSVTNPAKDRKPLAEFVQEEAERLSAVMPDLPEWVLNEGYRTHYTELAVEQVRGLRDTVKQLEHLARREQKQYLAIRAMEFAEERGSVLDVIRENWSKAFDEDGLPKDIQPDFVPSIRKAVGKLGDKFAGEFLNAETIASILGGGKFTVVNESLFGRLSTRSDWKAERLSGLYKELKPLFDAYSMKEKFDFARKDIATPAGLDTPLTRENALVVALLFGNADGRERMRNYGWSDEKQQAIVSLLDNKDRELANGIWKMFDKNLWPELKDLNDRTRGKAPPKVEPVPYTSKAGEWSGGYFKLKYDTTLDERAHRIDEGQAVKELLGGGMGMSSKTNQGSSTERVQNVRLRPRLDLGVFAEAINETVHDLAYREAVADTMRMLNDKGIQNAVKQVVGLEGYRSLVTRVREVAAPPRNPSGFVETAISVARRNTVINLMSGVKTALQNFTGLAPALAEVNAGTLGAELARFYSPKMGERYEFAMEHSAFMRQRFTNYDRDLQNSIKKLTVNGSLRPDESTFLALMGFVDRGVVVPLWNAAFKQGMGRFENDTAKAVDYADHVVRQTQGSGRDVDLAKIMSGHGGWGQLKKAFTMFYSYFNGQLNLLVKHGVISKLEAQENPSAATAKFAAKMVAIVVVPTVLTEMLMNGMTKDGETEEERHRRYAGAFVKYGSGFFPFVRDIVPGMWAVLTGDKYFGTKTTPIDSAAEGIVRAAKSAQDVAKGENDEKDTKNLIMGVGYLVGAPGKLIADTVDGTRAWLNGEAGPQAIILGPPKK